MATPMAPSRTPPRTERRGRPRSARNRAAEGGNLEIWNPENLRGRGRTAGFQFFSISGSARAPHPFQRAGRNFRSRSTGTEGRRGCLRTPTG